MEAFNQYFLNIVKNQYANFDGRARRKEYWMYILVYVIIMVAFSILGAILGMIATVLATIVSAISGLLGLALLVPTIAVGVRRLHDTNKSGWFMLLGLVPIVQFYLIYLLVIEGDKGDNQYGPDPKAGERV